MGLLNSQFPPSMQAEILAIVDDAMRDGNLSAVSGALVIATSRAALATDSGGTWELANGVTYTLTDAAALPAGVTLVGPVTGSATISCTGTATINNATSSVTVSAGQVYAAIPRASSAVAFVVQGS